VQEGGRRAGTENVAGIAGIGKAAELAKANMTALNDHLIPLRDKLLKELPQKIEHVIITGHPYNRLPGHASFCIEFVEGESMLMFLNMQGIAVTSGSACTSRALLASHVLIAIGLKHEIAQGSLLFGAWVGKIRLEDCKLCAGDTAAHCYQIERYVSFIREIR